MADQKTDHFLAQDTKENHQKRRGEGPTLIGTGATPTTTHEKRPMSAIIPSIMGEHKQHAQQVGPRSGNSTSGSQSSKQHKLKQRFTVIRKLGKGTYGKVQLAINKETGQEVAIKTIKKTKIDSDQDLERVRREIQIMSSIEHPHIIHIYEVFENKDKIVLIMQYAPGGELYEYVSQSKALDEHEARRLFRQIATAIYYCHQNKICHRDLKLENILLDEKNNAKLADFGLSNVFDKSRQLKTFCGSPLYASPEIVQGSPYEGPEVDCWSLGVLLYTLVYGAMPFDGSNFKRLVKQISDASYYEPKQRSQASPLISRLLCADPTKRASIKDICLDPWVNGQLLSEILPAVDPASARLSPNNGQGMQHPPLLKVAQDMANLTPVRLDILLALTPGPSQDHIQAQQTVPTASQQNAGPSEHAQMPLKEVAERPTNEELKQQQQQQQQKESIMAHFGSDLMDVDEARSTSPVASYVVRDLATEATGATNDVQVSEIGKTEPRQPEEEQMVIDNENNEPVVGMSELKTDKSNEEKIATEQTVRACQLETRLSAQDETKSTDESAKEISRADSKAVDEPEGKPELRQSDKEEPELPQPKHEEEPLPQEPIKQAADSDGSQSSKVDVSVGKTEPEVSASNTQPITGANDVESASGQEKAKSPVNGSNEETCDGKPKRVKKRIIVVKKKKKVVKKEADNKEQSDEATTDQIREPDKPSALTKPEDSSKGTSASPRKVRIPETFQAGADGALPSDQQQQQSIPPKQVAMRRQSALIADVSQKLLQQQQQDISQTSSSAIEMDQHQLASVRVSDTKSEFERRASLATTTTTTTTVVNPTSGSTRESQEMNLATISGELEASGQVNSQVKIAAEPTLVESLRETVGLISPTITRGEPVIKQAPMDFDQLRVISLPSEPQTPTNANQNPLSSSCDDTLARCADLLVVNVQPNQRSDSVETIKGDSQAIPNSQTFVVQDKQQSPTTTTTGKNVRSSLQIDLHGARGDSSASTCSPPSRGGLICAGSLGPAPITRSYKKVTFTKDGTCVTETGRIYSTQADDGTVRHIERKSKVTHYPSDTAEFGGGPAEVRTSEATTHEEFVYESSSLCEPRAWDRSPRQSRLNQPTNQQLKRLVMPLGGAYDEMEMPHTYHDSSAGTSGQFYRRDRAGSGSSCSSGSTDVFDDIFDTWTGAISMFNQGRHLDELRGSLMNRAFVTGSPLPFGQLSGPRTRCNSGNLRAHSQRRPQSDEFQSNPEDQHQADTSAKADHRCGSANVTSHSVFGFGSRPKHHRHGRQHGSNRASSSTGRASVEPSGYESDVPFERPCSATLGSARGHFGSSNLYPRPEVSNVGPGHEVEELFADDWPTGGSLLERMELEHEMLRRRFAQQRRQMWKGSTPSIHEIPTSDDPQRTAAATAGHARVRHQSGSNSSLAGYHQMMMAQPNQIALQSHPQSVKRDSIVCQTTSGSSLRQSTPLDASPRRRNTANLAECLPPKHTSDVGRSSSRTSIITSRLANIQLSQPGDRPLISSQQQPMQHRSASFIELNRNSSSTSVKQPHLRIAQPPPNSETSLSSQSHQMDPNQTMTPTTCCSNTTTEGRQTTNGNQRHSSGTLETEAVSDQRNVDANSRIQSWLLQSSGNLSVSSGSKSSASDATLPSSSGRSDSTAAGYLASSAGQMLRHDDPSLMTPGGQPCEIRHHQRQHSTRTMIGHQLPPLASPAGSNKQRSDARTARPAQPISMIVRSTSRQSVSELEGPGHLERHQVYESRETIVAPDDASQSVRRAQQTATSSAQVCSRKVFAFPELPMQPDVEQQPQRAQIVETRSVTTSSKQVFSAQRSASPSLAMQGEWAPEQAGTVFLGDSAPMQLNSTRHFDDFNDFDSLIGSCAELESHSSSSLLEQLRSRGYRSIMNQRMVGPGKLQMQQQQQQQQTHATTTTSIEPDVVTSSSNSMMTMSSSGVGGGPSVSMEDPVFSISGGQPGQTQSQQGQREFMKFNPSEQPLVGCQPSHNTQAQHSIGEPLPEVGCDPKPEVGQIYALGSLNGPHIEQALSNDNSNVRLASSAAPNGTQETVEDPTSEPEELDEDVREAKANIKGYLDRIRETEKFIKSVHQEEEKFERQRKESFLLNNLILSTKLNGFVGGKQAESARLQLGPLGIRCDASNRGPFSAPVTMMSHASYDTRPADDLAMKSCNGMLGATTAMSELSHGGITSLDSSVSCFNSDIYKPVCSNTSNSFNTQMSYGVPTSTPIGRDPLEPVQPISVQAYAPPIRHWRRSKSQLGDQFHGDSFSPLASSSPASGRLPLSANIDSVSASNPYFPSRHRRSASQVRYQPSSAALMSSMYGSTANDDTSPMVSEYRSAFGAPSLHQERQRHHSLAPACQGRARSPRATSPFVSKAAASRENARPGMGDDADDDDVDMSAYRPGSYVPRVVPERSSLSARERGRTTGRSANESTRTLVTRGRSISGAHSPNGRATSPGQPTLSQTIGRRRSMVGSSELPERDDSVVDRETATRRRSWTTNETSASDGQGTNTRLSELEQRIQANKRRREELLQGINSNSGKVEPGGDRVATNGGKDDEDLEDSFGFERPSRQDNSSGVASVVVDGVQNNMKPAPSMNRFRASRLESMEARIKRKSYCVRVRSPDQAGRSNQNK